MPVSSNKRQKARDKRRRAVDSEYKKGAIKQYQFLASLVGTTRPEGRKFPFNLARGHEHLQQPYSPEKDRANSMVGGSSAKNDVRSRVQPAPSYTPGGLSGNHDRLLVPTAGADSQGRAIVVAQTEVTTLADNGCLLCAYCKKKAPAKLSPCKAPPNMVRKSEDRPTCKLPRRTSSPYQDAPSAKGSNWIPRRVHDPLGGTPPRHEHHGTRHLPITKDGTPTIIRLSVFLDTNKILPIHQYGFRPQRAVQDATLRFTTSITNTINSGHIATAAFLDLERACNKVWHAEIIVKLVALACPPHLLRAISGFLRNRTARVRVAQSSSPLFILHAGVPQGSILSPLLFIVYCWDLPCPTDPNVHQQQYADDTVCWATSNDPEDANQKLQLQLAALESWMRRWRIKPNPSNTQLIQFKHRHKRPKTQPTITLWETEVTSTNNAKYLGINFNATLYWCTDIHICLKQVRRRMNLIMSLRTRLRGCSEQIQTTTYKAFSPPKIQIAASPSRITRITRRTPGRSSEHLGFNPFSI
ncbi:hypothetical protein CBL_20123 [Carabus blaptoides fortunei]